MHCTLFRHRARAFTLIELLVVISIVALLVGIITPALGRARDTARNVRCLNNLKALGTAMSLYMDQRDGRTLPRVRAVNWGSTPQDPSIIDVLSPFMDAPVPTLRDAAANPESDWTVAEPWRCPSDTRGFDEATQFRAVWSTNGSSYEYAPGAIMTFAEQFLFPLSTRAAEQAQLGTSRAIEQRSNRIPVFFDADDWHNPRFTLDDRGAEAARVRWKRNATYYGDWRAAEVGFQDPAEDPQFFADIARFGGSPGIPGGP